MSEAIFDAWDKPAGATVAAEPVTQDHPHPQLSAEPVEVITAQPTHRETPALEFSQRTALVGPRAGDEEERLAALEDKIFANNLSIVDDMTHCFDIDPRAEDPPEEWVRELGPERARRRLRVARGALMPLKDAPLGLSAAKSIVASLAKARAVREVGRGGMQLNVMAVFPTQVNVYEELVVKDD